MLAQNNQADPSQDAGAALQAKYQLRPDNHHSVFAEYAQKYQFDRLHRESKRAYQEQHQDSPCDLVDHVARVPVHLDEQSIQKFAQYFHSTDQSSRRLEDMMPLIQKILSPQVDTAIKNYFQSEYALIWCNWYIAKHPDHADAYLNKWHCDAGPQAHLKTITYFDATEQHGSGTAIASLDATEKLKSLGYVMNDIRTRQIDISDLTSHYDIDLNADIITFEAGDTLIFNPTMRMHRVELPRGEEKRHAFSIGFVPSPLPWFEVIERGLAPQSKTVPFETFAGKLLTLSKTNSADPSAVNQITTTAEPMALENQTIVLDHHANINSLYSLKRHLCDIFQDEEYAEKIKDTIVASNGSNICFSVKELLTTLKTSFQRELPWGSFFSQGDLSHIQNLLDYEMRYQQASITYSSAGKPNPDALMWPMPNHPKYPRSKFETLPYVQSHKILDKTTPIASAGSCFAYEIAKRFQAEGFNYLVEEPADALADGVYVDQYKRGDEFAPASANYGILFNTPSLIQLAQRAFGLRQFQKYCTQIDDRFLSDPYRENVYFDSVQAFEQDYDSHIQAVRRVLTKSEVFIFTAGLNECWEMHDGTVISRNPKASIQHLLKHKTLTVQENIDNLRGFVDIVRRYNPNIKFIISLSPVPLLATGRAETHHIIEANTHSKAVLRVAIDEVVRSTENVFYLPSYELVTECTQNAWLPDHRHVTPETVDRVIGMFKDIFVKESLA